MKPILISIEGAIGSGKTTLMNELKAKYPDWHFIDEPLETWTSLKNEDGENLLSVFYKDIDRWAYTFQNCAVLSRAQNIRKAIDEWEEECKVNEAARKHNIFVTERCLETDFNVFAQMLRDDKKLNGIEWGLYKQWYRMISGGCTVNGLVFVGTPPDVCAARIKRRAREGEENITKEYLENLDLYHRRWIDHTCHRVFHYNNVTELGFINQPSDVELFIRKL
jgi:deoxyadenosine/deoxycytidine kinase